MSVLLILACILWGWAGLKTWAFVVTDLMSVRDRQNVAFAAVGGLLWPLVYVLLLIVLVSGVLFESGSWATIKDGWRRTT